MSLFFFVSLYWFKFVALVTGVMIVLVLGLGILLIRELNLILSVTEEYDFPETIDAENAIKLP